MGIFSSIKIIFKAILNPKNHNYVKLSLLSPLISLDKDKLTEEMESSNHLYLKPFYYLNMVLKNETFPKFINKFLFEKLFNNESIFEKLAKNQDCNLFNEVYFILENLFKDKVDLLNIDKYFDQLLLLDKDNQKTQVDDAEADGVNILTTFMSKGLEFDIVFALDCAFNSRVDEFDDINEINAEKLRNLYVGLTRAKYRVYVPLAFPTNCELEDENNFGSLELFLKNCLENKKFNKENILEKLDVLKEENFISYTYVKQSNNTFYGRSDEKIELIKNVEFSRKFEDKTILSFSNLAKKGDNFKFIQNAKLPSNAEVGQIFHKILEKIFNKQTFKTDEIKVIVSDFLKSSIYFEHFDIFLKIIDNVLNIKFLNNISFREMKFDFCKTEIEFLYKEDGNYFKGFIDLVFSFQNIFYIVDWKSNLLGLDQDDYSPKKIMEAMESNDYLLQGDIYSKALKKYLDLKMIDYKTQFGGIFYLFLRGIEFNQAIFYYKPKN